MSKSQPQVTSKLNDWYDWLINHVPKTIKDGASRAFDTFKDQIMEFYNRVAGNQTQHKIEGPCNPNHLIQQSVSKLSEELTEAVGLMEDPRWMLIHSSVE